MTRAILVHALINIVIVTVCKRPLPKDPCAGTPTYMPPVNCYGTGRKPDEWPIHSWTGSSLFRCGYLPCNISQHYHFKADEQNYKNAQDRHIERMVEKHSKQLGKRVSFCHWRGTPYLCAGECGEGEVEVARASSSPYAVAETISAGVFQITKHCFGDMNCKTGSMALCCS